MAANFNPGIVYMTASLVLFAIAVVLHFHSLHLSLPISSTITILTIILPVAAFLNAFVYPNLLRNSSTTATDDDHWFQRVMPVALQGLQAVTTTALATILAGGFVRSKALDCVLDAEWQALYAARDGESIRFVQDTLRCCGYAAVDDRAFPFQSLIRQTCAEIYGRDRACQGPWRGAMETHSGIAFGVVLAVGLMQILGLVLMRSGTSWWTALRTPEDEEEQGYDEHSRLLGGEGTSQQAASSAPVAGPSTYAEAAR
ncbi:tetraspanin Tsp3 [Akanthomyces lecanii RCEF 1005]|uniref:Tetraspanin Tsp3 n=1 Tax=Akanthomyces lecanii RCEF 1005 TaxID=1081108 RepID=A0A168ICR9_CORDF|nr:tetraspanin Tsp3 [Akanthomyces lecanii RCEF 1005]